jgi:hypothetical protein
MRIVRVALAVALGLLAAPAFAEDEIWVWTTADGSVHYTDERERIPDAYRESARVAHKEGSGSYQRVPAAPAATTPAAEPAPPPAEPALAPESAWREEASAIDARIAALVPEVEACRGDHVNLSPGDGSRKRREEHEEAARCAEATADLARARAEREELEERARREGAPPGWVRARD